MALTTGLGVIARSRVQVHSKDVEVTFGPLEAKARGPAGHDFRPAFLAHRRFVFQEVAFLLRSDCNHDWKDFHIASITFVLPLVGRFAAVAAYRIFCSACSRGKSLTITGYVVWSVRDVPSSCAPPFSLLPPSLFPLPPLPSPRLPPLVLLPSTLPSPSLPPSLPSLLLPPSRLRTVTQQGAYFIIGFLLFGPKETACDQGERF